MAEYIDFLFIILTTIFCFIGFTNSEGVYVTTRNGLIKGRVERTVAGTTFHSFIGIPFAEPPIGNLRFQAPVAKKPWSGEWDATFGRGCCYQMTTDRADETEDCLYINVYVPKIDTVRNSSIPVMAYIYGGGFIGGCSDETANGPDHLIEQNVILVTFNYRVGPFGFFSTGDDTIPGNAGLKDQNLALVWIQENIQYFGGDSTKVTIFGESAGGASAIYHVLSPKSKGLFRAAMAQSGSSLSPWAQQRNIKSISYYLFTLLNGNFTKHAANSSEILKFLQSAPAKAIDDASFTVNQMNSPTNSEIQQGCFFAPTLEHEHEGAFITKPMFESIKNGQFNRVPLVIGVNSEELLRLSTDNQTEWELYKEDFDKNHTLLVPHDLNLVSEISKKKVGELIKQFYLPTGNFSSHSLQLIKYFTDQCFAKSILAGALMKSQYTDVYLYQFAYRGVLGQLTNKSEYGFSDSVVHAEDVYYYLTSRDSGFNTTDLTKYPVMDQIVTKRMIGFFTNFAKYLNPTPNVTELFQNITWPKLDRKDFKYMDVGSYLEVRKNLRNEMLQFWEKIYIKYGVPPLNSY